jgi:hypothetical protein
MPPHLVRLRRYGQPDSVVALMATLTEGGILAEREGGGQLDDRQVDELLGQLDSTSWVEVEAAWEQLKEAGVDRVALARRGYPKTRKWQGRVTLIRGLTPLARDRPDAVALAVYALEDCSYMVRWRACEVLAYSLDRAALPYLAVLLGHGDHRTVEVARGAIRAIESQNHHLFKNPDDTGAIRWMVRADDAHDRRHGRPADREPREWLPFRLRRRLRGHTPTNRGQLPSCCG